MSRAIPEISVFDGIEVIKATMIKVKTDNV
jgi:hypothetical protein